MKRALFNKAIAALAMLIGCQNFGFYFYFTHNEPDKQGRPLPSKVAVAVYESEKKFKQFLKDQLVSDKSRGFIIKYGPIYGKVAGKLAAPVVEAIVKSQSNSSAAAKAAGKVTQKGMQYWWSGIALIAKAMGGPIRTLQQHIESTYHFNRMHAGHEDEKHPNPVCRSLESMAKKKNFGLNEDRPKPIYVVVFNTDKKVGKDYEVLFNKYLYPMGPDPYNGNYYTGTGKARGGPFASWTITTRYEDTPLFMDGIPVKDAQGNLIIDPDTGDYITEKKPVIDPNTGQQKIESKIVADLTMIHDRGGIDCSTAGKNLHNAPDQGGTLATDTTQKNKE